MLKLLHIDNTGGIRTKIEFTIPGPPCGKGRPRFVRKGKFVATYTPAATANYETLVKLFYTQSYKGCMLTGQIKADIKAYYPIPKSTSKKQRQAMLDGKIRPTKKPDWDNIGKIICDALNSLAYKDDSAIVCGTVDKFYSENPRVEVVLEEFES